MDIEVQTGKSTGEFSSRCFELSPNTHIIKIFVYTVFSFIKQRRVVCLSWEYEILPL